MISRSLVALLLCGMTLLTAPAAHAQWLTMGAGATLPHLGLARYRTIGPAGLVALESERTRPGVAHRWEISLAEFEPLPEGAVGPLVHLSALVHRMYVAPLRWMDYMVEPYAGVGGGPTFRGVEEPTPAAGLAVTGAATAGLRVGDVQENKYGFIEWRTQLTLGGPSAGSGARALFSSIAMGVNFSGEPRAARAR